MKYILAHDLGTTGNKASLFDELGRLVASHLESYPVDYPQPQWAEQDPEAWWRAVCHSTRALLQARPDARANVAAVAFSGQMMGVVAVSAANTALRPAIIWADQRAVDEARTIEERLGVEQVYGRTGHRISPAYTAAKILWIKRHHPELYTRTTSFLCAKDYIVLKLTGEVMTDYSDASGSNLFDLRTRTWRADFIERIGLDPARMPPVNASTTLAGKVTRAASEATGLAVGTPVVLGGGDGACAAAGAGVVMPGECYCNIGSSAWISFSANEPLFDSQMRTFTFCHVHPTRYTPMGTMQAAGGARDWLQRIVGAVSEEELYKTPPGARGVLFLPYLIGERSPWWNPQARGAFVGLSMSHGKADLARAVLEGVTFNLKLILDTLESQGAAIPAVRFVGGAAKSAFWQQLLADVLNKPVQLLGLAAEATAWGAAVTGGIGVGMFHDWSMTGAQARITRVVEPRRDAVERYAELAALYVETYHALEPIYKKITD